MSCQFLITRTFSMLRNLRQKGYVPGRALAEGKCDSRCGNAASIYLRTFASRSGALHVDFWLDACFKSREAYVLRHLTVVFSTPFAVTPLQPNSLHTSANAQALRDVFGFSRPKINSSGEDAAMKEVTNAIHKLSEDPLLQYASLEPKLSSIDTSSAIGKSELNLESSEALLSYVKLAQESSLKPPSYGTTPAEDEDLKALEGFASLGDRKDD